MKGFSSGSQSPQSQPLRLSLSAQLSQELQPSRLVPTLTAGLIAGVLLVIYAISMAALIFTGPLAEFVPVGIGLALFTAIVIAIVVALTNAMPGIVIMPQDSPAIILAMMAGAIATQIPTADPALLPTVMMGLAIATSSVGIVYYLLGSFKLGNLIRFIPYPVVGGFLAGTGYLLAQGAFNVMTDRFFNLADFPTLLLPTMVIRWLPGCVIGLLLVLLLRRYDNMFIMPTIIVGSILAFYVTLWLSQTPLSSAREMGLLFGDFPEGGLWRPLHWSMVSQVKWPLIFGQADKIATIILLSVIALLLNVSGIELAARQDIDLNRELQSTGIVILILFVIATVGFLQGVGVGIVVSVALFVFSASRVNVTKYILSGSTYQSHTARSLPQSRILQEEGEQIYILSLQGFLFFGTANALLNRIQARIADDTLRPLGYVVLNFQAVNVIDSSAVLSFVRLKQLLQHEDIKLVLTHLSKATRTQLKRGGCLQPDDPVCQVFPELDRGLEWCENDLLGVIPLRRARSLPLLIQLNDLFRNRDHAAEFTDYLEEWDAEVGEIVYQRGQVADAIDLIEVGEVTVYLGAQQNAHRIQTLGAGNMVGSVDFFQQTTHQTSAIVEAPSTLYRLSTESFQRMQQEQPEVAVAFQSAVIQILGDRLTYAYKKIADLLKS